MACIMPVSAVEANGNIRQYFVDGQPSNEDEAWVSNPELPSTEEILGTVSGVQDLDDCIELTANIIDGPWPSRNEYLKTHYMLLREDAVAPLRDAVAYFRADPGMNDSNDVSIYEKVHIIGITFTQRGLAFRIRFVTNRARKNIVWEYSKRLMSGSVVALSPAEDCFRTTCLVAVVAARPLDGVKQQPPEIDIFFAQAQDAEFDPQKEWIMVESRNGYFESTRHTMTALQRMTQEKFPMAEHICELKQSGQPPEYVRKSPVVDVSKALGTSGAAGKIDLSGPWPALMTKEIDPSQWEALRQILTNRLAIIQGPPGTGKTHISVISLKIILNNMQAGEPPLVIAAQTNQALDQLLKHVARFEPRFIRLGGRSIDMDIKNRTLYAIRQKEPSVPIKGSLLEPARKQLKAVAASISEVLRAFSQTQAETPLTTSDLLDMGIISQIQHDKLEEGAKDWIRVDSEASDPLFAWLGNHVARFEAKYVIETFGFTEDEVDFEYEQLKELEAEQAFEDDEHEALKGQYLPLRDCFTGVGGSTIPEKTVAEYLKYRDMWKIPTAARGAVYNKFRRLAVEKCLDRLRRLFDLYNANCHEIQIGKWERDYLFLKDAKVIGLTTTGLGKYRGLVASVKPRVVMIEEAAEAIEAPVSVSCIESLEHLILIGDHRQLRGRCAVQELEDEPFFLSKSMFERLVHNGMHYTTLTRQRRMAPEIRRLLGPIYGELKDHPCVKTHRPVSGMGGIGSFFFSHDWPESSDSLLSKCNEKEALMITEFYLYLVLNGVSANDITVLTFYNGQRKKLLKHLKNHPYLQGHYVKVVTVDSYQGEENEVVILSLVRSSASRRIGFLSVENRVCVAISRAKRGFYIFGNAECLANADPLWWQIIKIMGAGCPDRRRLGYHLPLMCVKHKRKIFIQDPSQWAGINGGCEAPCAEILPCGHSCGLRCHSFSHDQVSCNYICGRQIACGHFCPRICSELHTCACKCEAYLQSNNVATLLDNGDDKDNDNDIPVDDAGGDEGEKVTNSAGAACPSRGRVPACSSAHHPVQKYHDFANGGAREQDLLLIEKTQSANLDHIRDQLDHVAFNDLFCEQGDTLEEESRSTKADADAGSAAVIAAGDGSGGTGAGAAKNADDGTSRGVFVGYYDPAETAGAARQSADGHLLDLSD